jgi:hypothetical protein
MVLAVEKLGADHFAALVHAVLVRKGGGGAAAT